MSSHADTIRRSLRDMHDKSNENVRQEHFLALESLDALLAENQRLDTERDMLRRSLEGEMAENQRLRDALQRIKFVPVADGNGMKVWEIARVALAGDTE